MRKATGIVATALMAGALWTGGLHAALAQDATPIVPDASECVVEPRSMESLDGIVAIWNEQDYAPDPDIAAGVLPAGTPASDDVVQAVDATLREFTACSNAGDWYRQLALMTDDASLFFAPQEAVTIDQLTAFFDAVLATPVPAGELEPHTGVTDVTLLADGRVGAVSPAADTDGHAVYLIFVEQDSVWLLDGITEIGSAATPTA